MRNCEIHAKVVETGIGTVNLNGFIFNVVKIEIANIKEFYAFIQVFTEVEVGTIFQSTSWAVTRYVPKEDRPEDTSKDTEGKETEYLAIRVDDCQVVDKYEPIPYFNAKVTGMVMNSDKCKLMYVGPTRRPFYRCTLKLRDEFSKNFSMLLCAFKDNALSLSTLSRLTLIQAEVCIRPKRFEDGYELCINNFNVMEEK